MPLDQWHKQVFKDLELVRNPRGPFRHGARTVRGWIKRLSKYQLKGLILAQNERWRCGLGMQVVRET